MDIDNRDELIKEYVGKNWPYTSYSDLSESDKDRIENLTKYQWFRLSIAWDNFISDIKKSFCEVFGI